LIRALAVEGEMTANGLSEQQKDELVGGRHRRTILTDNSVVAVDEVGLLGTRQGLELLRHREELGFTIVALGDDKQTGAIQAGDFLSLASRALGAEAIPVITSTVRQQTAREKQIVGLFREGRAAEALTMKRQDGTAVMVYGGRAEVVQRVAKLYAERLSATGQAPTISAPTNSDAHRIGEAVREERRALGMLGPDLARVKATDGERNYALALAAGDRVRLFKSTGADIAGGRGGTIGRNGSIVEVVNVTDSGIVLKGASGKVGTVTWDKLTRPDGRAHLAYGDAMTVHTVQGSTANEHIFALPEGSQAVNGRLGYTANTRHRHAGYIVTSETAERVAVSRSRPINDRREVSTDDKWANVAAAFSYQPVRDTAMAMFERVGDVRRGAVRAFHGALAPAEQQQAAGQAPSLGHEHVHTHKVSAGLTRDAAALVQRIADNARAVVADLKQRLASRQEQGQERRHEGPSINR
jgi:ATP-dependent exoDNAse (exonuclease V) alpha subunit